MAGAHPVRGGVRFTLFARHATAVKLLLFDAVDAAEPSREIAFHPRRNRHGECWSRRVRDVRAGQLYLYRVEGPLPSHDPDRWLLDPAAEAVAFPRGWGDRAGLRKGEPLAPGAHFPKGVVVDHAFDWRDDRPPDTAMEDTVLYELHVRGFTRGPGADVAQPGTYAGLREKIPYLRDLGVTAVELLPVHEFNELEFYHEGGPRAGLLNYWGYSTLAFFAPQSRYAADAAPGAAVRAFKELVRALHAAGIEVILDVVFNHTAENGANGPVYSMKGIDAPVYYLFDDDGKYVNVTGCGNTVNANAPAVSDFIVGCLRHWVEHYHVDGFRFDLATALTRGADGEVLKDPPLIRKISDDPVLRDVKLIAEPWDATGYRHVGTFPGRSWSEWNDRFRDDVRAFWAGLSEGLSAFATRLCGSADLYDHDGQPPSKSVNMVTCHDGFTLADLVRYAHKHNEANGEENRDGPNGNGSANYGVEGPSDDPALEALRARQQRNLLATVLLALGVPHLLAGDEFGQTQGGNNNAYCQDNETTWLDWFGLEHNAALHEFVRRLIAFRREQPALRRLRFFDGGDRHPPDIAWYGVEGQPPDWAHGRALACRIDGGAARTGRAKDAPSLLLVFNAGTDGARFLLPREPGGWRLAWSTQEQPPALRDGDRPELRVEGRSVAAFLSD